MSFQDVQRLAGLPEWYPTADDAVTRLVGAVLVSRGLPITGAYDAEEVRQRAYRLVRDVLAELATAYVAGLITIGDEHEFAYWALLADQRTKGQV